MNKKLHASILGIFLLMIIPLISSQGLIGPIEKFPINSGNVSGSLWNQSGNNIYYNGGNVGIGTSNPVKTLDIVGNIKIEDTINSSSGVIYKGDYSFLHNYGYKSLFLGEKSGNFYNTGQRNLAFGFETLNDITSGRYNTVIGSFSLPKITSGTFNTIIGSGSMIKATTASYNTFIGGANGNELITGNGYNVGIGISTLANIASGGTENTAIGGINTLNHLTTGDYNVAIGSGAGQSGITTARGNVLLGYKSGFYETTSNNLIIDNQARPSELLGRSSSLIYGKFDAIPSNQILSLGGGGNVGIGTTSPTSLLTLDGDTGLTLKGDSRVEKCYYIDADGIKAPGSKPASFVESGLSGSWEFGNEIEVNQQTISGNTKIPCDADRTEAPTFNIGIYANGVSPGVSKWQLEYLFRGEGEDMTASPQETLTATATASATSNGLTILSFNGIDSPSSTDKALSWKLTRLSADSQDTISDSVYLKGIFINYIADKLGHGL